MVGLLNIIFCPVPGCRTRWGVSESGEGYKASKITRLVFQIKGGGLIC